MNDKPPKIDISDEMIAERRGGSGKMPADMPAWMANTITSIDKFSKRVGNVVCWILIPLILAMTYEVIMRKLFLAPTIWAYDMSRFLYGALFMLGAGYALSKGVHIRADFLYRNFKTKNQGLVDFWLYILFYFPGLIIFLYMTIGYVEESIRRGERGMDTTWMPFMWPIKSCLLIGIVFLLIQGVSELLKSYWAAKKGEWPGEEKKMIAELIDPAVLGIILVGVMLFAIFVGFPISFTLIFLGFVFGYLGFGKLVFYLMTLQFSMVMTEQTLAAVPLFVFMGIMMEQAGLMERLFSAFQLMLARVRGSLYYAVLFVSVIFAAATGIVGASVTILGIMAAKSMNRSSYNVQLAAGTITAGGTLGILIPPSIMLVVMGPIMEIPVIDLFAAAILPGILLASLFAAYTTIRCMLDPKLGPPLPVELRPTSMKKVWIEFLLGLVPPAALVFAALGSILLGFATPTEAAGCGAMGALLLSLAYKKLTLPKLQEALVKTLEITALIMVLVAASNFFGAVFARLGTPTLLTEFLLGLEMNKYLILAMIMAMIFLLGWPLEWVPIVMIIIPIILPLVEALGFNLTWFAILVAVNLQTCWLSPPVALSAYFLKGVVPEWDLKDIYLGMMQFMVLQLIGLILIVIFPQIALWLPTLLYGN